MTTPPFPYVGGKITLGPRIAALLPEHKHYVEPYAGSLAVLFAKKPSVMETVNDLDSDIVTFWRVLRDQPDELIRACALTPHSRQEYAAARSRPEDLDDVERARRIWTVLTQSRSGTLRPAGWRHFEATGGSYAGMPGYLRGYVARMDAAVQRLQRVTLESRPALEVVAAYGRHPEVLLYVDPPYLGTARKWDRLYQVEMYDEAEHRELLAALLDCHASVVLSGYASPMYDEALDGWDRVEMTASTGQGDTYANRTEVLWSNRSISEPTLFDELVS